MTNYMYYIDNLIKRTDYIYDFISHELPIIEGEIENLTTEMELLKECFILFQNKHQSTVERYLDSGEMINLRISLIFDFITQFRCFVEILISNIKRSIKPIPELMVSIQLHDIHLQNIQMLKKYLNYLVDENNSFINMTSYEKLDKVMFSLQLISLLLELNDVIELTIDESIGDLKIKINDISEGLSEVKSTSQEYEKNMSLDNIFKGAENILEDFSLHLTDINKNMIENSNKPGQKRDAIFQIKDDVDIIKDTITANAQTLKVGICNLISFVEKTQLKLDKGVEIISCVKSIREKLNLQNELLNVEKSNLLTEEEIDNWSINNKDFLGILDEFRNRFLSINGKRSQDITFENNGGELELF